MAGEIQTMAEAKDNKVNKVIRDGSDFICIKV